MIEEQIDNNTNAIIIKFLESLIYQLKNNQLDNTQTFMINEFVTKYNQNAMNDDAKEFVDFINMGYLMYQNLFTNP